MSGDNKAWIVCIVAICIAAICIGVFTMNCSICNHKHAFENGYVETYEPSSYMKVWTKCDCK